MAPETHAFEITTCEGSRFIARFDPVHEEGGIRYGRLRLIGYARSQGRSLDIRGIGAEPEAGGNIVVSDKPLHTMQIEGETVPVFPSEHIQTVQELEVPATKPAAVSGDA